MKSLGLTNGEVVKIVTLVPQFFGLNMDSVHCKLQALDELFGKGEGVRLWASNSHLIGHNTEELRRSFEYLTKVVGMTPDRISENVQLIMRNVDRLVRPRYEYLSTIQSRDLEGVKWIKMANEWIKMANELGLCHLATLTFMRVSSSSNEIKTEWRVRTSSSARS